MATATKLEAGPVVIDELLTVDQLALRLSVRRSWIFEQTRARGKIRNKNKTSFPVIRLSPRVLRFHWPSVCAWLMENKD